MSCWGVPAATVALCWSPAGAGQAEGRILPQGLQFNLTRVSGLDFCFGTVFAKHPFSVQLGSF